LASLGETTNSWHFWQIVIGNLMLCSCCNDSDSVSLLLWFAFSICSYSNHPGIIFPLNCYRNLPLPLGCAWTTTRKGVVRMQ
jgi:hypothetical protein